MAFKIDMGWFQGNFGQILSRFTWELPQTLFGHLGSQTENLFEGVKSVSYYGGATAVETYSAKWGGFTLGSFIIGHRGLHADPNNSLFQHEYGHYLQSRASGPLYLGNTQSRVSMIRCSDEETINTIRLNKMPTHVPLNILKKNSWVCGSKK